MPVFNKKALPAGRQGFTLVELLVVMSIMVILGLVFTNILVDSLKGRNKVAAISQVKQNGQVVLDKISNDIRNAEKIICLDKFGGGTPIDTIVILNSGTYTQFRFFEQKPNANPPTNGRIQKVNFTVNDFTGDVGIALCSTNFNSNIQNLTDTDSMNGVSVTVPSGGQNVFEQNGNNVVVRFNASAGVKAGSAYDVTVVDGGIPFSTSVQMRGIKQ